MLSRVNQFLSACEKLLLECCHGKYFFPWTSPCSMVVVSTRIWIRLGRKKQSSQTSLSRVNCEIKLSQVKLVYFGLFILILRMQKMFTIAEDKQKKQIEVLIITCMCSFGYHDYFIAYYTFFWRVPFINYDKVYQ